MRTLLLSIMIAYATTAAYPQDTTTLTHAAIDDVVITGTRTQKRLSAAPLLTTIIRSEEVKKSAAANVLETLQDHLPGFASTPNAMGSNLRLHGLSSRYILFLVDGEKLVNEGADGNINLEQIDINTIERIELVPGAASALYGSGAMAAVINLITKQPHTTFDGNAYQSVESNNTLHTNVSIATKLKYISIKAAASRSASDGFTNPSNGVSANPHEDYTASTKIILTTHAPFTLNVNANYYRQEIFNPTSSMNVVHDLRHKLTLSKHATYTYTYADSIVNTLKWSAYYDKYFDYDVMERLQYRQDLNNTATGFTLRVSDVFIPKKTWELTAGVEYNNEDNYSTNTLGAVPTNRVVNDYNVYAQAEYTMLPSLTLIAGSRYTLHERFGSAVSPKVACAWNFRRMRMRAGIGHSFRAPSIKEMYYDFNHQGMFLVKGNPDLLPERGLLASLSTEYSIGSFHASITGYWNNIYNKINQYDVAAEGALTQKHYENIQGATLTGADVEMQYSVWNGLLLRGAYSYCNARNRSDGTELAGSTKHSATASAVWNHKLYTQKYMLALYARVSSSVLYQQISAQADGFSTATNMLRSSVYHIYKVVCTLPFHWKQHVLELTMKVDNILNFHDISFVDSGRRYMLGLRYTFTYD